MNRFASEFGILDFFFITLLLVFQILLLSSGNIYWT